MGGMESKPSALERLIDVINALPMDEAGRLEADIMIVEAVKEQAELVEMVKDLGNKARAILSRFAT